MSQQISTPINLSVTTRGIGFNTCNFYYYVSSLGLKITLPDIYCQYRSYLGLFEQRLMRVMRLSSRSYGNEYFSCRQSKIRDDINFLCLNRIPILINKIISAVGVVTDHDDIYVPLLVAPQRNSDGTIIPRPENIVLSTLRETVEALADEKTPLIHRERFENKNPIPGTIWENHLLKNPDEIILGDYNYESDYSKDVHSSLCMVQSRWPNYFTDEPIDGNKANGRRSIFMSNEIGNLYVPSRGQDQGLADYYKNCRPTSDIEIFSSPAKLSKEEKDEGAMILVGERPEEEMTCGYEMRDKKIHTYTDLKNYMDSIQQVIY